MTKTAIVTGGANGIGKEIVKKFASNQYNTVIADIDINSAESLSFQINKDKKGTTIPLYVDVSGEESVLNMIKKTTETFGKVDILINCAAIQTITPFEQLTFNEWKKIIDVNLHGIFLCCKYASEEIKKNQGGNITNITSIHYDLPRLNKFPYDASKAAVSIFTQELALEFAKYKINVNAIAPGAIETPMNRNILDDSELKKEIISRIPWERMGKAEEVADLALFLVSDKAKYITGQIIRIDGGSSLRISK